MPQINPQQHPHSLWYFQMPKPLLSLAALTFIFPLKSKTQTHNQRGNVPIKVKTWYTFESELVTAINIKIRLNVLKWNIKSLLAHCRLKTDTTEKNLYSEKKWEVFCFHDTVIPFLHFHHKVHAERNGYMYWCSENLTITATSHMLSWGTLGIRVFLCCSTTGEILLRASWYSSDKTLQTHNQQNTEAVSVMEAASNN